MHGMLEEAKHLTFVIHRVLEKKLKAAGLDLSATQALTALKCVRVVDFKLGDGAIKRAVTRPTPRAALVLRAVGVTILDPPHLAAPQRGRHVETIPVSALGKTR